MQRTSALRKHQREASRSAFVFVSERGAPLSAPGFSRMVERTGRSAKLGIKVHAHMLRHACGQATTLARYRRTWAIAISRTPRATPRWRRIASRGFGETEVRRLTRKAMTRHGEVTIRCHDRCSSSSCFFPLLRPSFIGRPILFALASEASVR